MYASCDLPKCKLRVWQLKIGRMSWFAYMYWNIISTPTISLSRLKQNRRPGPVGYNLPSSIHQPPGLAVLYCMSVIEKTDYRISLNNVPPWIVSPFLKKLNTYIKKEHYSNFCTFEITSLVNVPGHYLRKYGIWVDCGIALHRISN